MAERQRIMTCHVMLFKGIDFPDQKFGVMENALPILCQSPQSSNNDELEQVWEPSRGSLTLRGECPTGTDPRNVQDTYFPLTVGIPFQLQWEGCRVSLQGTHWLSGQEVVTGKLSKRSALVGSLFVGPCWWLLPWRCPPRAPCRSPSLRFFSFRMSKSRLRNLSLAGYDPRTVILGTVPPTIFSAISFRNRGKGE